MTDAAQARARALLQASSYVTLATSDAAGRPWASPVWFAWDGTGFLWASRPGARHSQNIAEHPEVGAVVFDSSEEPGAVAALYAEAVAEPVAAAGLAAAVAVYSARSTSRRLPAWTASDLTGTAAHRLYRARVDRLWLLSGGDRRIPVPMPEP